MSHSPFNPRQLPVSLLLVCALFGLLGCKPAEKRQPPNSAPPVEATQAITGSLPLVERLSGTVWAENQVVLYPEVSGRIAEVLVGNGESVTEGQDLVRLAGESAREQVRQAEAGLRIEEARLRQSKAALAEVEAQAKRIQSLSDRNLVTEVEPPPHSGNQPRPMSSWPKLAWSRLPPISRNVAMI